MLITPDAALKFVELKAAIPFVLPSAAASSIVIVLPVVVEFASVNAPEIAEPPVPPAIERTPSFEIVIAPVDWSIEIP